MWKREGWLAPCEVGERAETGLGQEGIPRLPRVGEGETRSQSWLGGGFGTKRCRSCCREVLVFSAE